MPFLTAALAFLLAAHPALAETAEDYTIVEVNGDKIAYSEVQSLWDGLFPSDQPAPDIREFNKAIQDNVVRGVVSERLMLKEAEASKLAQRAEVKQKLEATRRQILVQEHLRLRNISIDEAEIRKHYDELVARLKNHQEAHASHILLETEKEAREVAEALKKDDADFAALANQRSAAVGSAANGGDLGYFSAEEMVPEFSEAVFALAAGAVSEPIESGFGWHIITLHDLRDKPVPAYEAAKANIEKQLRGQANQDYIRQLLEAAEIHYFEADGSKRNFPIEADATTAPIAADSED